MAATGLRQRHGSDARADVVAARGTGPSTPRPTLARSQDVPDAGARLRMAGGQQAEGAPGRDARSNGADLQASIGGVDGGCPQRPDTDPFRASVQASRAARAYDVPRARF
jgi:hypothetical protein